MNEKEIEKKLTQIGKDFVEEVKNGEIPKLHVPLRTTSNLVFDEKNLYYVIGDKMASRSIGNTKHVKKVAQLLKVASFCKDLVKQGNKHVTKRELYYISESWGKKLKFEEQPESDDMVEDIEAIISEPRENIKIIPNAKGSIYGDISLKFLNPKGETMKINCLETADGQQIGPRTCEAEFIKTSADKIIAIETSGMYNRLLEENAQEKFNALLVNLGGQASRSTRIMIKRLYL